ncbi:Gfo/Idh/MocA family protein [Paenibacillus sp. MBLB4367]|uniref:Gfo/Idh/MocA family protein n=1 Tax=Paenibacillus sp. MBLB4367 TaxID=3384767 RepID=UPI00390830B2
MEKVRVGFIGVGGIAEYHLNTLKKVEQAVITAVHDINAERAQQIATTYGATAYETAEQLLDSGQIDALYICTPPFARNGIEQEAAKRGIHLLSEKPVTLNLEEAKANARVIREAGIINSSGYCLRYLDNVQHAKKYLAGKEIDMVLGYRIGGMPPVAWWRKMELSGGQLVEQSTHQVDLIRYLAGDFAEVHAIHEQRQIQKLHPEATVYDVGVFSFKMQSGAAGNFSNTSLANHFGRADVEFFGRDFYMQLDGNGTTLRIIDDEQNITIKSKMDFYLEQNRAFVEAVRTKRQDLVLCSYDEAVATLEVTLAVNESAAQHRSVSIPGSAAHA